MAIDRFSSVMLPWLFFVIVVSFILDFVLVWLNTSTFIYLLWKIKPEILTCSIRLWCDTASKRDRTCCVVDIYSSKITEYILAACLVSAMSPALPLSFGRGYPFLLEWNAFVFNGIYCWFDAFYLDLCWHVPHTAVGVESLSIVVYYFYFSLGKVVPNPPTIRWVTCTFSFFLWWAATILKRRSLGETVVSLSERLWPKYCYF